MRFRPQLPLFVLSNVFLAGYFMLRKQSISDTLERIERESEALETSQRLIYTSLSNVTRNSKQTLKDLEKNYEIIKEITEFTRGNYIRIKGVHEKDRESLEDKVLELAEYMNVNLKPEDIERVNRIGVKKGSTPRAIVVLLSNFKLKVKLLRKAASALRNTPFVLQDDLPNFVMPAALSPVKKTSFSYECGYITEISKPVVKAKAKKMFGAWLRDPISSPEEIRDSYIWTLPHFYQNNVVEEYANLHELYHRRSRTTYKLPYEWGGTGHVVYNGSLYFVKYNTSALIKYNFSTRKVITEKNLVGAAFGNVAPYQWSGSTDIDLSVDETGMWAIYATVDNTLDIVLSRLSPGNLEILQTWRTNWRKQWSGNAFMACGILYVLKKYDEQETSLSYIYDTTTKRYKRVQIPFINKFEWNTMLEYNYRDKLLYAWDRGYLVTYNLTMSSEPI